MVLLSYKASHVLLSTIYTGNALVLQSCFVIGELAPQLVLSEIASYNTSINTYRLTDSTHSQVMRKKPPGFTARPILAG